MRLIENDFVSALEIGPPADYLVGTPTINADLPSAGPLTGTSKGLKCGPVTGSNNSMVMQWCGLTKRIRHRFAFRYNTTENNDESLTSLVQYHYISASTCGLTDAAWVYCREEAANGLLLRLTTHVPSWSAAYVQAANTGEAGGLNYLARDTWYVVETLFDYSTGGTDEGLLGINVYDAAGTLVQTASGTFSPAGTEPPIARMKFGLDLDGYGGGDEEVTVYYDGGMTLGGNAEDIDDDDPGPIAVIPYDLDTVAGTGKVKVITDRAGVDCILEYGAVSEGTPSYGSTATLEDSAADGTWHIFSLTGLTGGTSYSYRVTCSIDELNKVWTKWPDINSDVWSVYVPAAGESFAFAAVGDAQSSEIYGGYRLGDAIKGKWASNDSHPVGPARAMIWNGDLHEISINGKTLTSTYAHKWCKFFYANSATIMPYVWNVTVLGNHDLWNYGNLVYNNAIVPYTAGSEGFDQCRIGDWEFFTINGEKFGELDDQLTALAAALAASNAPHKAVCCHRQPIGGDSVGGPGGLEDDAEEVADLLDACTLNEVDVLICAHQHRGGAVRTTRNGWPLWVVNVPRYIYGGTVGTLNGYVIEAAQQASEELDATSLMRSVETTSDNDETAECRGYAWIYALNDGWRFILTDCDDPSNVSPVWTREYSRWVPKSA